MNVARVGNLTYISGKHCCHKAIDVSFNISELIKLDSI